MRAPAQGAWEEGRGWRRLGSRGGCGPGRERKRKWGGRALRVGRVSGHLGDKVEEEEEVGGARGDEWVRAPVAPHHSTHAFSTKSRF